MTQEEAINELVLHAGFVLEEIEGFEEYGDGDPEMVEMNKKELEAFTIVLGTLDSELATREGLKTRYKTLQGAYGFVEEEEPGEIETELYNLLEPWHNKHHDDFYLESEENKVLAIINKNAGELCHNEEEADENDTFDFYPYRGKVCVIMSGSWDGDFAAYCPEFQAKALEIIKAKINNG